MANVHWNADLLVLPVGVDAQTGESDLPCEVTRESRRPQVAELQTATAEMTIADAIITLADAHVPGLPVLEEGTNDFIGVLSTSDVLAAVAECGGCEERGGCRREASGATNAIPRFHRLFVRDGGKLVGVISQSDIVCAVGTAKI